MRQSACEQRTIGGDARVDLRHDAGPGRIGQLGGRGLLLLGGSGGPSERRASAVVATAAACARLSARTGVCLGLGRWCRFLGSHGVIIGACVLCDCEASAAVESGRREQCG